jgi:iron complex outermembrane receptor protein
LAFGGILDGYSAQRTDAEAVFGELTYTPTDRLSFIAGVRYSHERRSAAGGFGPPGPRPAVLPPLGVPVAFNSVTPRASVRYRLTDDDDNVYFTYSQGFKSGGFNISGLQPTPFKPEKLNAYEVGLKTSPSRVLSANIAGFYYDYTNQQVMAAVDNFNITANAASSRIYGADADVVARVTPEITITTGIEVLDARYRNYTGAIGNLPILNPDGTPCYCGNNTAILDLSGGREPFSPTFSASVSAEYRKETTLGLFDFAATMFYTDKYSIQSQTIIQNPRYATLALRASFQPEDSHFTFYVWGKNITGARYFTAELSDNSSDQAVYARPATYGAGVKYEF